MNAPHTTSNAHAEAPPSYFESIPRPVRSARGLASSAITGGIDAQGLPPPSFSTSPITFFLSASASLITAAPLATACSAASSARYPRALYELSHPLNSLAEVIGIAEIYPKRTLTSEGRIRNLREKDVVYRISQERSLFPEVRKGTVIAGGGKRTIQGTALRRSLNSKLKWVWEARCFGDNWWKRTELLYYAEETDSTMEWKNGKGEVVAVQGWTEDWTEEKLEIRVALEKKLLDMLVAVWVGRMYERMARG